MKKIQTLLASALMLVGVGLVPVFAAPTVNAAATSELCRGATGSTTCNKPGETNNIGTVLKAITNILLFLVGAVSVIMIIVGGLRYVTSGGDSSSVTSAKNTVLYAIVGLIVAAMAYAIVNFVLTNL